jgi:hypothetical protein
MVDLKLMMHIQDDAKSADSPDGMDFSVWRLNDKSN